MNLDIPRYVFDTFYLFYDAKLQMIGTCVCITHTITVNGYECHIHVLWVRACLSCFCVGRVLS